MKKEITKFDYCFFSNRWKQKHVRQYNWVIFGLSTGFSGPNDFYYRLSFFGLEVTFWFKREFVD